MDALFELIGALLELFFGERGDRGRPVQLERAPIPYAAPGGGVNRVLSRKRGHLYRGLWVRRARR
jgi:hypothetical protein